MASSPYAVRRKLTKMQQSQSPPHGWKKGTIRKGAPVYNEHGEIVTHLIRPVKYWFKVIEIN